jgi:hypothetical protein
MRPVRLIWAAMLAGALAMTLAAPAVAQDDPCDTSSPTCIEGDDPFVEDGGGGSESGGSIEQSQSSNGGAVQQQHDQIDEANISAGGDISRNQDSVVDQRVGGDDDVDTDDDDSATSRVSVLARTGPNILPIVLAGLVCLAGGLALRRAERRSPPG